MDIHNVLVWGKKELEDLDNPCLEAEVLLCEVLHCDRVFLKTNPRKKISWRQYLLNKFFVQQRKKRIPLAYILGHKDWAGFKIKVNKNVLIPRDETEILVQKICSIRRDFEIESILDIGTGSGNIAIFLAKEFPEAGILALDNSSKTLKVAKKNIHNFEVKNVGLLKSDLLSKISSNSSFDIITANLPYVPEEIEVSPEVKKEPREAIFAGRDGLGLIRELTAQIKDKQIEFRELWLEFLPFQKKEIARIFSDYEIEFFGDLNEEIRFIRIRHRNKQL